jgi:ornithine--oxo-acid transaminase
MPDEPEFILWVNDSWLGKWAVSEVRSRIVVNSLQRHNSFPNRRCTGLCLWVFRATERVALHSRAEQADANGSRERFTLIYAKINGETPELPQPSRPPVQSQAGTPIEVRQDSPNLTVPQVATPTSLGIPADVHRAFDDSKYSSNVNPHWVRLLRLLQMDVRYTSCEGAELFTTGGDRILDFLSGYCVHNAGHNHPYIINALKDELDRKGPAMLQSHVPERAGELAERLCRLAGGPIKKAFFCSSGSEGVEAAVKFARVHTGRTGLLHARGAFHGLTCGALSLMGESFWSKGFGPLLPGTEEVPFNDLAALSTQLSTRRFAAYIVEPVQGEAGIRLPEAEYLFEARELCRKSGTLFVLDEVQTGFFRTGKFLAAHHYGVEADMIVLAKAMSGGLIPTGAVLMTDPIYHSVYGSLKKSIIHTSTFSENGMSMRAGLATLDVLEQEQLGARALRLGEFVRTRLRQELSGFEMIKDVRGVGLFSGIEFGAPRPLSLRVPFETFNRIHPAMFGQVLVMRLFRDHHILTQICGNDFMVLKAAPPLVVREDQLEEFVQAVKAVVQLAHSPTAFWGEALKLAGRVVQI